MNIPIIKSFFDDATNTISYVVIDEGTSSCAVIDSVLDFDYSSGVVSYEQADEVINYIKSNNLNVAWLLETHVHADHLSAAPYIQEHVGGKSAI